MTQRIHLSIPVSDLTASVAFYSRLFAAPASKQRDDYANFRLDEPPIHLALVASRNARGSTGVSHFGVELPDHAALERWRGRQGEADAVDDEPQAHCCYAVGDKFWIADPDGHRWEIWVRTGDFDALASTAVPATSSGAESSGCACDCA